MTPTQLAKLLEHTNAPAAHTKVVRANGQSKLQIVSGSTTVVTKPSGIGLEIHVSDNTPFEVIDLPVLITQSGFNEMVENDFFIGANSNVVILAACGICHNGCASSSHSGVHKFVVGQNAKLKYVEKHYANGAGEKIINPTSQIKLATGAEMIIETAQLEGVDQAKRITQASLGRNSRLEISERILTSKRQTASTLFTSKIAADGASLKISSRSVATDNSTQQFTSRITGKAHCFAHVECDAIVKDNGQVAAKPEIFAQNPDANLIHEASIGKIAGEQLIKLMTLGIDQPTAEKIIIEGFLR